jgi:succinoglycan biosynthesis protein ExoU
MVEGSGVAVIIPLYNAEKTIARAVSSALAEPEVVEVVVVDDVSSDGSVAAARACDDGSGRLKVLTQDVNQGPSAARNWAILESRAPWIALLDSDDFFLSGRMAGLLEHADGKDFVADDMWQVDEGAPEGDRRILLGDDAGLPRDISFLDFVLSNVSRSSRERGELGFIKPIMRRAFLEEQGISYREDMRLGEDYELYARSLAAGGRMVLVPAQGYVSVVRTDSLSGLHSEQDLQGLRDCDLSIDVDFALKGSDKQALRAHYLDTDCRLQWRLLILAVKARNVRAALSCFMRPWPVPLYLAGQLWGQVVERLGRRLAG